MANVIDKARSLIEERLAQLEEEARRLRDALANLGSSTGKPSKAPARTSRKRAKPGQREKQLLASVSKHPDYKPGEHAKAMRISANQVYALARKLQKEGKLTKTAKGTYKVKGAASKKGS